MARINIEYMRKRIQGVQAALKAASNKALIKALQDELSELETDIKKQNKKIRDNEAAIQRLKDR